MESNTSVSDWAPSLRPSSAVSLSTSICWTHQTCLWRLLFFLFFPRHTRTDYSITRVPSNTWYCAYDLLAVIRNDETSRWTSLSLSWPAICDGKKIWEKKSRDLGLSCSPLLYFLTSPYNIHFFFPPLTRVFDDREKKRREAAAWVASTLRQSHQQILKKIPFWPVTHTKWTPVLI